MVTTATSLLNKPGTKFRYERAVDYIEKGLQTGKLSPGQRLPSLRELSKDLGVSFLTVHRAFKDLERRGIVEFKHGAGTYISPQLPHLEKRTSRIALAFRSYMLDQEGTHPSLGALLAGVHQRCKPSDYVVQSLFYDENHFTEDIGQALLKEKIDGVVVFESPLREEDFHFLRHHHLHTLIIAHLAREDNWTITLTPNRQEWLSQAVEHLRGLGHQRIGLISYAHTADQGSLHRHFTQLAFDHRLGDPNELLVLVRDDTVEHVTYWQDVENFFRIHPLPTAVVVKDEFLADVLLDGCERRGIKVPDQLSMVALQDARPLGHRLPLTAVHTTENISQMAASACDLLIQRIQGKPIPQSHVLMGSKLVAKASTGPVPVIGS